MAESRPSKVTIKGTKGKAKKATDEYRRSSQIVKVWDKDKLKFVKTPRYLTGLNPDPNAPSDKAYIVVGRNDFILDDDGENTGQTYGEAYGVLSEEKDTSQYDYFRATAEAFERGDKKDKGGRYAWGDVKNAIPDSMIADPASMVAPGTAQAIAKDASGRPIGNQNPRTRELLTKMQNLSASLIARRGTATEEAKGVYEQEVAANKAGYDAAVAQMTNEEVVRLNRAELEHKQRLASHSQWLTDVWKPYEVRLSVFQTELDRRRKLWENAATGTQDKSDYLKDMQSYYSTSKPTEPEQPPPLPPPPMAGEFISPDIKQVPPPGKQPYPDPRRGRRQSAIPSDEIDRFVQAQQPETIRLPEAIQAQPFLSQVQGEGGLGAPPHTPQELQSFLDAVRVRGISGEWNDPNQTELGRKESLLSEFYKMAKTDPNSDEARWLMQLKQLAGSQPRDPAEPPKYGRFLPPVQLRQAPYERHADQQRHGPHSKGSMALQLATDIGARYEGNPFFISELLEREGLKNILTGDILEQKAIRRSAKDMLERAVPGGKLASSMMNPQALGRPLTSGEFTGQRYPGGESGVAGREFLQTSMVPRQAAPTNVSEYTSPSHFLDWLFSTKANPPTTAVKPTIASSTQSIQADNEERLARTLLHLWNPASPEASIDAFYETQMPGYTPGRDIQPGQEGHWGQIPSRPSRGPYYTPGAHGAGT